MVLQVRRADSSDAKSIDALLEVSRFIEEKTWGSISSSSLIELSAISLVAESDGKIVAFCSIHTHSMGQGISGDDFFDWANRKYIDFQSVNMTNTLTLTSLFGDANTLMEATERFLNLLFLINPSLDALLCAIPETAVLPNHMQPFFQLLDGKGEGPALHVLFREELITPVSVRPARVEDHDDLMPVFKAQAAAADQLGEFFVARLIQGQDEHNRALVAEADGRAVGLLCVTTEVDLKPLHDNFDLESFDYIVQGYDEEVDRVHEDYLAGEKNRMDTFKAAEEERLRQCREAIEQRVQMAVEQRDAALEAQKRAVEEAAAAGEDEAAAADSVLVPEEVDQDIERLLQSEFQAKEYVAELEPSVVPSTLPSNAMCVTLFCVEDSFRASVFSFMQAAFSMFNHLDYAILAVSPTDPHNALTEEFKAVPHKLGSTFGYNLFVFHRASLLASPIVTKLADSSDEQSYADLLPLVEGISGAERLEETARQCKVAMEGAEVYCARVGDMVAAAAMVVSCKNDSFIRFFDVGAAIDVGMHDNSAAVLEMAVNPVFAHASKVLLQEILRQSGKSALFHEVTGELNGEQLASVWQDFTMVLPRKIPSLLPPEDCPPQETGLPEPSARPSCLALQLCSARLLHRHVVQISSRILVVGASDAGVGLIWQLLAASEFRFHSITLVSPGGLPSGKSVPLAPSSLQYADGEVDSVTMRHRISIVDDKLASMDRENCTVTLTSGASLPYDILILTPGLQDGNLDRMVPESGCDGAFAPHSESSSAAAEAFIANKVVDDLSARVVVAGTGLGPLAAVQHLLASNVDGNRITLALETSVGDTLETEAIAQRISFELEKAGVDVLNNTQLLGLDVRGQQLQGVQVSLEDGSSQHLGCSCVLSYSSRVVDDNMFRAVNGASLVLDGKIVVDGQFCTTDSRVLAGGSGSKFARRLADRRDLSRFSGRELGTRLFNRVIDIVQGESGSAAGEKLEGGPKQADAFLDPVGSSCVLPGGYHYLHVECVEGPSHARRDGPGVRNLADKELVTDTTASGLCRIRIDHYARVASITMLSLRPIEEPWKLLRLTGLPQSSLNQMSSRFSEGRISDLREFLSSHWSHALVHDRSSLLLAELYELVKDDDDLASKLDSLDVISQASLSGDRRGAVEKSIMSFLTANSDHLASYITTQRAQAMLAVPL